MCLPKPLPLPALDTVPPGGMPPAPPGKPAATAPETMITGAAGSARPEAGGAGAPGPKGLEAGTWARTQLGGAVYAAKVTSFTTASDVTRRRGYGWWI